MAVRLRGTSIATTATTMKRVESCAIALALSGCFHTKTPEEAFRTNAAFAVLGVAVVAAGALAAHSIWQNPDAEPPELLPAEALLVGGVGLLLGGVIGMVQSRGDSTPTPRLGISGPPGAR